MYVSASEDLFSFHSGTLARSLSPASSLIGDRKLAIRDRETIVNEPEFAGIKARGACQRCEMRKSDGFHRRATIRSHRIEMEISVRESLRPRESGQFNDCVIGQVTQSITIAADGSSFLSTMTARASALIFIRLEIVIFIIALILATRIVIEYSAEGHHVNQIVGLENDIIIVMGGRPKLSEEQTTETSKR